MKSETGNKQKRNAVRLTLNTKKKKFKFENGIEKRVVKKEGPKRKACGVNTLICIRAANAWPSLIVGCWRLSIAKIKKNVHFIASETRALNFSTVDAVEMACIFFIPLIYLFKIVIY